MKIGILGGGQLGRMFIQEALKYDDEFYVLDPNPECSCANISHFTRGDFNDYDTVLEFGKDKDVVTIEIEHVNADALEELENQNKPKTTLDLIIQSAQQMQLIQDTQQIQAAQIEKIESNFRIENWQQKRLEEVVTKNNGKEMMQQVETHLKFEEDGLLFNL